MCRVLEPDFGGPMQCEVGLASMGSRACPPARIGFGCARRALRGRCCKLPVGRGGLDGLDMLWPHQGPGPSGLACGKGCVRAAPPVSVLSERERTHYFRLCAVCAVVRACLWPGLFAEAGAACRMWGCLCGAGLCKLFCACLVTRHAGRALYFGAVGRREGVCMTQRAGCPSGLRGASGWVRT